MEEVEFTKECRRCRIAKDPDQFGKQARHLDGLKSYCKPCTAEYLREHRATKPEEYHEKRRAQGRNYYNRKMGYPLEAVPVWN